VTGQRRARLGEAVGSSTEAEIVAADDRLRSLSERDAHGAVEAAANYSPDDERPMGVELLDEVREMVTRFVVLPDEATVTAVTLYAAATHAQPAWEHATRLVIKSPLKRCGKSRLQEVLAELVHRPIRAANVSTAALVRCIDRDEPPTFLLDETDAIFATRRGERSEKAEDLRGILNAGHARGLDYLRWNANSSRHEFCPTFAMAVIAGIGDLPDTIEDRAVIISMRRRAAGEYVTPFRRRRAFPVLHELRDRLHEWVRAEVDDLALAEPELPVEDRAADVWEPLVAIADAAGGPWPHLARTACATLTGEVVEVEDATTSERLLADLRLVFGDDERLPTATILERLRGLEESPWRDWRGRTFEPRDLAGLLRPYRIKSHNIRLSGDQVVKGYAAEDFAETWMRYVPTADARDPSAPVDTAATALHVPASASSEGVAHGVAAPATSAATGRDQAERHARSGVADETDGALGDGQGDAMQRLLDHFPGAEFEPTSDVSGHAPEGG
jgi:hypothetical protein